MKVFFTPRSKQKAQILGLIAALFLILSKASGQVVGDYGSSGSGSWTTAGSWVICVTNGTWTGATVAGAAPTSATNNTVYVRSGHTITYTSTAAVVMCKILQVDGTLILNNTGALASVSFSTSTSITLNGTISLTTIAAFAVNCSSGTMTTGSSARVDHGSATTGIASTFGASTANMTIGGLAVVPTVGTITINANSMSINGTMTVGNASSAAAGITIQGVNITIGSSGAINTASGVTAVASLRPTTTLVNNGTLNNGNLTVDVTTAANGTCDLSGSNKIYVRSIKPLTNTGVTINIDLDVELNPLSISGGIQVLGANGKSGTIVNIKAPRTITIANTTAGTTGSYIGISGNSAAPTVITNFDLNVYGTINMSNSATTTSNYAIYLANFTGGTTNMRVYNGGAINLTNNAGIDVSRSNANLGTVNVTIDAGGQITQAGAGLFAFYSTGTGSAVTLTINGTLDLASTVAVGTNKSIGGNVQLNMGGNSLFRIKDSGFPSNAAITTTPVLNATSLIEYYGTLTAQNATAQVFPYRNVKFSNTGGITFSGGYGNVNISGNLTLASGCSMGTNTAVMNGTTAQTIDANSNTLGSLTINNALGVTLLSPVTISTTLSLTSGKLTLGSNNLSLTNATVASGISPASPTTNYIVTNGTGALVWSVASGSTAAYKFPIGSSSAIQTALVDYAGGTTTNAGTLAARFVATSPGSTGIGTVSDAGITMNGVSPTGYWEIINAGVAGGSYAITVDASGFKQNDNTTAITDFTNIRLIKRTTGGSWANSGGTSSAPSGLSAISISGLSSFSDFGIGGTPGSVLSVDFKNITATAKGKTNLLAWSTASEKENATFQIERSADGSNFQTVGSIKGNGTTNDVQHYTFTDDAPLSMSYYRLRQMDVNGTETMSKIVSVARDKSGFAKVYPSVASSILTIERTETTDKTTLTVSDIAGRAVLQQQVQGSSLIQLDINGLAKGWYILTVESGNTRDRAKFIKQ